MPVKHIYLFKSSTFIAFMVILNNGTMVVNPVFFTCIQFSRFHRSCRMSPQAVHLENKPFMSDLSLAIYYGFIQHALH